jgi:hypothetical protein
MGRGVRHGLRIVIAKLMAPRDNAAGLSWYSCHLVELLLQAPEVINSRVLSWLREKVVSGPQMSY